MPGHSWHTWPDEASGDVAPDARGCCTFSAVSSMPAQVPSLRLMCDTLTPSGRVVVSTA